jgi:hypothetical protein
MIMSKSDTQKTKREKKPKAVKDAVRLVYISIVLGIINYVIDFRYLTDIERPESIILSSILSIGVGLFLTYMISRGKNWARYLFLLSAIIGVIPFFLFFWEDLGRNILIGLLSLITLVLELIALAMLFKKESSEWFNQ